MNVKKKFRNKLRIFESFNGKNALQWSDGLADSDGSTPVLLGIKQKNLEEEPEDKSPKCSKGKQLKRQRLNTIISNIFRYQIFLGVRRF